ncbi:MAG: tetratricopeptide repeat protein [Nitrospira sp.]|nr:tetratricopeptide repeat protein [Nitrospira sp.]
MSEINPPSLMKENHPASHPASMENGASVLVQETPLRTIEEAASAAVPDGHEAYEQGTALKNAGLFKQAADHFKRAAADPAYELKGLAQMGLCLKKSGNPEEAVTVFRRALQIPSASLKEQIQILYLLGKTLESLQRFPEALEAYRWLRRESPQYRDVATRIELLSTKRPHLGVREE